MTPVPPPSSSSRGPGAWGSTTTLSLRALASGERIVRADDSAETVEFVRLFGSSALVGPQWVIDAAAGIPDEEMAQHVTLLTLTRSHGGHGLGAAALFFADDLPLQQPSDDLTVSHGNPEAIELEGLCPPDDVNEVGLSDLENRYTIVHEVDGRRVPVACGAYSEWEGLLAPPRRPGGSGVAAPRAGHRWPHPSLPTKRWPPD